MLRLPCCAKVRRVSGGAAVAPVEAGLHQGDGAEEAAPVVEAVADTARFLLDGPKFLNYYASEDRFNRFSLV